MSDEALAGRPGEDGPLIDVDALVAAYHDDVPDPEDPSQRVAFGTSGHRGSALLRSFNDAHVAAMTQAVVEFRREAGTDGPLFLGGDTHALSPPAWFTTVEVLVANGVDVRVEQGYTPTPAISHAIVTANRGGGPLADGLVITPSHNPPEDGGYKYNGPDGGPAPAEATAAIERRANELLATGNEGVQRVGRDEAMGGITMHDIRGAYVDDLGAVVDLDAIREAGVRIGVDPLGGAAVAYWQATTSTSRSSTTRSTRPSASCTATGTAASAWTAPRPTRCRGWSP